MKYILGINAFHGDSSAAIFKDGQLIAATEEERILRIKHWAGMPAQAIEFCLKEAGVTLREIDAICVSRDPSVNVNKKIKHLLKHGFQLSNLYDRIKNRSKVASFEKQLADAMDCPIEAIQGKVQNIEHHRSHLASAFYPSPFEEAALISIDGMGDFTSTMVATAKGNDIQVISEVNYPHSLGMFYTSFTQYLGFPHYGDEYKVMGLAPYGKPEFLKELDPFIQYDGKYGFTLNKKFYPHFSKGVDMNWVGGSPVIGKLYSKKFEEVFGPARKKDEELTQKHKNLATSVQRKCEEIIFQILTRLQKDTGLKNLCISGGVAQNSVANGKIISNTGFDNVYVPCAGHDAGTAAGAALYYMHQNLNIKRRCPDYNPYTGYKANEAEIEQCLSQIEQPWKKASSQSELFDKVCDCLENGGVVGWYQGRAEFGPRALGHRSILADPRRNDVKEILNLKIKRRESFRPFAPSILKEYVDEYFENADFVPFMEKVYPIRPEKHAEIPAVTHVDGTGRLQSVDGNIEPKYYGLINRFRERTGVPILVNTSFNENEPIVNRPQEALDCFLRTKMDMLVLEDYVVTR
ncbi:carbamoyltransferase family protein [Luteibaculum oceani]|uniref:Carbamoyltransferase n=1 Tax=Luteibaculum oceani TaxID=1294296 RepID=A0A5C6VCU4_9FLAO|nr:carbamoyltransferase C-terminal domain-containing protein [Luteibaculum oceani]TXC81395.1 carbamoyltransferase [Luteibaculum oceani]